VTKINKIPSSANFASFYRWFELKNPFLLKHSSYFSCTLLSLALSSPDLKLSLFLLNITYYNSPASSYIKMQALTYGLLPLVAILLSSPQREKPVPPKEDARRARAELSEGRRS
jgi:hypothetical protein